jgi:chromate reductase
MKLEKPGARNIGVIVGSLRAGAYTRMLARNLPELAPAGVALQNIEIADLPLYNQDLETDAPPPAWTRFRQQVIASDAVLFVTPEYNRSIPGALKNALDVGSRPWGHSAWSGKRAGVISLTPGALGAMAANLHLRQVLYAVNLAAMAYPEAYIPAAATLFDESGRLVKEETRVFLKDFLQALESWVQ